MNPDFLKEILKPEVQKYIKENLGENINKLLLKKSPFPNLSMQDLIQQIQGIQIISKKVPDFLKENMVFPPHLNLEQTSSQPTARYKSDLVKGNRFVDLTSGFGIDAFYVSKNFQQTTLVEQNSELLSLVQHNWKVFGKSANIVHASLEKFLEDDHSDFDLIYLDPARRDAQKKKVFLLEDLSPNILELQDELLKRSKNVLIKLSPLIDLKYLTKVVKHLSEIHIVGVKNEVKEILLLLDSSKSESEAKVFCVNLETNEPKVEFNFEDVENCQSEYSDVCSYLYIPNNMLLKSGAFHWISEHFQLKKLHPNTHFYTSEHVIENFPGRILKVKKIDSKRIEKGSQYNIVSKNYPLKPEEIKKKYKLKDGGNTYLIFTQSVQGKIILKSLEN